MADAIKNGMFSVKVSQQPEAAPAEEAALESPQAPETIDADNPAPEAEEEDMQSAGPAALETEQPEAPAAPAPAAKPPVKAPAKKPRASKLPDDVRGKIEWHDHMVEIGKKHPAVQIAYAKALVAEGIPLNAHLKTLLENEGVSTTKPSPGTSKVDSEAEVEKKYGQLMREGKVLAAQRYLIQQEALAKVSALEAKMAKEDERRTTQSQTDAERTANDEFEDGMIGLQPAAKQFMDVTKEEINGRVREVARFKSTPEAKAVQAKMVELANKHPNDTLEELYEDALVKLGMYGVEPQMGQPAPKPGPRAAAGQQQQRPASRPAPSNGLRNGMLRWKVAVKE